MNYIVLSENENFKDGAQKIKVEASAQTKKCKVIEIHNIDKKSLEEMSEKNSLIYFLTNDISVPSYIALLGNTEIKIINKVGLTKSVLKFALQEKMRINDINIPKSTLLSNKDSEINKINFPLFIKSQKQADIVTYCKNETEFNKNMETIYNIDEHYIEEAIEGKNLVLKKFYCIKELLIDMDQSKEYEIPTWLKVVSKNISESLGLDVFSTDIFIDWSERNYYCIDINPASSFFKSDIARIEFVKHILI